MMARSELGSAVRYRWRSLASVFLFATALACALLGSISARPATPVTTHQVAPPLQPQGLDRQVSPSTVQAAVVTPPSPSTPPRPRGHLALRDPDQIHQLQTSLWAAIERRNAIETRLAELAVPAAPIVRQPTTIAPITPELRAATTRVATARSTLADLQTRYTDAYPDVIQAKDELDEAERALYTARHQAASASVTAKPRAIAPAPLAPQAQAERDTLHAELEQIGPTIPDLQNQLQAAEALPRHAPADPAPYWPLVLPTLAQNQAPAPVQAVPSTPSYPVQPAPAPPLGPATPASATHFLRVLPQSMLLGVFASLIVFILLESLDRTIKGPESLRAALPEARQISLGSMRA